jgi:transcriptional regulator with XRE-family HTH domain
MTVLSNKKAAPREIDQLAKRIHALRMARGLSQRKFAEEIGVSHTQISEWERGTEKPSNKKIVKMGHAAPDEATRLWFWREAGVDDTGLRKAQDAESESLTVLPDKALAYLAPVVERVFLGIAGEIRTEGDKVLFLPLKLAEDFASVFYMKVPNGEGIPHFFAPGDYVVIDRQMTNLDNLVDSIIAVYFEERPPALDWGSDSFRFFEAMRAAARTSEGERLRRKEELRLNREANPKVYAESDRQNEQSLKRIEADMAVPVVKFGWLRIQYAGGHPEGPWKEQVSRVALEIVPSVSGSTGTSIPLTEWIKGINPIEPKIATRIKRPAHIVGRLVGWFKDNVHSDSEAGKREF